MRVLIISARDIVDPRTFRMIHHIIQRMYVPYSMKYLGKIESLSERKILWELRLKEEQSTKVFSFLLLILEKLHEFEHVSEHKPIKYKVIEEEQ